MFALSASPIDSRSLDRAVARATGECLRTIRSRGFSLLSIETLDPADDQPLYLQCPGCGGEVLLSERGLAGLPAWAECPRCDAAYPYRYDEIYAATSAQ